MLAGVCEGGSMGKRGSKRLPAGQRRQRRRSHLLMRVRAPSGKPDGLLPEGSKWNRFHKGGALKIDFNFAPQSSYVKRYATGQLSENTDFLYLPLFYRRHCLWPGKLFAGIRRWRKG
jgi:hypothetical protein